MTLKDLSFKNGTHPDGNKELSKNSKIREMGGPKEVVIPLQQHIGSVCEATVKKGDHVKVGQVIGKPVNNMGVTVHSSVSGTVTKIEDIVKVSGHIIPSVFIENDGNDEMGFEVKKDVDIENLTKDEILHNIREAGISGMGGAGFPTHVKLQVNDGEIDTIILNGAECEPYLTCDDQVMQTYAKDIVEGLKLIMKVVKAQKGFIAIEDNKPEAIEAMEKAIDRDDIEVAVLKTKYPQGDEKRIIEAVTGRAVPDKGLPKDIGVIVNNVASSKAIYDAQFGIPVYKRVLTVTGKAVNEPSNLMVRIGTPLYECIEECGGLKEAPSKLVVGGPMMGYAQYTFDKPTEKGVSGILCLTEDEVNLDEREACISCNKCVNVCPQYLLPLAMNEAIEAENFENAKALNVQSCIACGACSYICPSNIPLVENFNKAKREIWRIENGN